MPKSDATGESRNPTAAAADYTSFIILSDARTGSNMLAQALNSSRYITCFREVFNFTHDFVQFDVEGYDNFSETDLLLRSRDPISFLNERIFCHHPEDVRAVGFKFLFQFWVVPGLMDRLVEDTEIRVLHLERRNLLRSLVSLKIARHTKVFIEDRKPLMTLANVLKVIRNPLILARLRRRFSNQPTSSLAHRPREPVQVSVDELYQFIVRVNRTTKEYDDLFSNHPKLGLSYEDMVDRPEEVFGQAQTFLDLEPMPLSVTMRRQNPEPLRELIENYQELAEAYKDTPHAWMFE